MKQMRWLELLSAVRLGTKKSRNELGRSPFHKDYDRIIFLKVLDNSTEKPKFTH